LPKQRSSTGSPVDFGELIADLARSGAKAIRVVNIKVE
jgi:hypothetical protein